MNMKNLEERINGYGPVLRLITPVFTVTISVLVTIMLFIMLGMSRRIERLDLHFTNHLMHHQDLEVGYADRLAKIEGNRFTDKDAALLETRIMTRVPPKWVQEKLISLERKTEVILEKIEKIRR